MTQRYAHLADEAMKRAASVIDECLDVAANAEAARPAGAKVETTKKYPNRYLPYLKRSVMPFVC